MINCHVSTVITRLITCLSLSCHVYILRTRHRPSAQTFFSSHQNDVLPSSFPSGRRRAIRVRRAGFLKPTSPRVPALCRTRFSFFGSAVVTSRCSSVFSTPTSDLLCLFLRCSSADNLIVKMFILSLALIYKVLVGYTYTKCSCCFLYYYF